MQRAQKERKRWDEWRARQEKYRGGQEPKNKGILALFGLGRNKNKAPPRRLQSSRPPGSSRPSYHSSNSHGSRAVRPAPKSGGQSYKSTSSRPHPERRSTNQSHRSTHRSSHRRWNPKWNSSRISDNSILFFISPICSSALTTSLNPCHLSFFSYIVIYWGTIIERLYLLIMYPGNHRKQHL